MGVERIVPSRTALAPKASRLPDLEPVSVPRSVSRFFPFFLLLSLTSLVGWRPVEAELFFIAAIKASVNR